MDLFLRDVDAKLVKQIDGRVAKINRHATPKLSRNAYLKMMIEREGNKDLEQYKKDSWDLLLEQQNKLLLENLRALNRIFWLMTQGDEEQAADLLERMAEFDEDIEDEQ